MCEHREKTAIEINGMALGFYEKHNIKKEQMCKTHMPNLKGNIM